jgi:hypothetical protein
MKIQKIYILLLICFYSNIFAQNFEGYVITKSNDTLKCTFDVQTNIFDETMFYPSSVMKSVKIINENGEKFKFYPNQIDSFIIKNTKFGNFKFVSLKADNYKNFYQEISVGRISIYKKYTGNMNGGYPIESTIYCKNDKLDSRETNFFNFRKWFSKYIDDYPELYQKWIDSDNFFKKKDVFEVIKIYNNYFKN